MTYTPNIPQSTDDPSQSQPLILTNFQQLDSQYGSAGDHVAFSAVSANGKHKKVTWIDQSASVPTAGLNEVIGYGATASSITMPYYKRDNIATVFPMSPIKAYASFISLAQNAAPQVIAPLDSFNITTITQTGTGINRNFAINLTNACRTANYGVLFFYDAANSSQSTGYNITSSSLFNITIVTSLLAPLGTVRMTVAVLEF